MKRRSFIRTALLLGALVFAEPLALRSRPWTFEPKYELNPDWVNAEFEVKFISPSQAMLVKAKPACDLSSNRYKRVGDKLVYVFPFKQANELRYET